MRIITPLYAKRQNADNAWETVETWENITGTQTEIDMEQYQGQELRFYVIANRAAGDTTGFDSPDGALCDPAGCEVPRGGPDGEQCGLCPGCAQPSGVPEWRNAANDGQRQHGQQLLLYRLSV